MTKWDEYIHGVLKHYGYKLDIKGCIRGYSYLHVKNGDSLITIHKTNGSIVNNHKITRGR